MLEMNWLRLLMVLIDFPWHGIMSHDDGGCDDCDELAQASDGSGSDGDYCDRYRMIENSCGSDCG